MAERVDARRGRTSDAAQKSTSGDSVADRQARDRFLAAYNEAHRLEAGGGKIVLTVGKDEFPFPIPLVPAGPTWRFDTAAGEREILQRRIGRNELAAIQVSLAYADAQREYFGQGRDGSRVLQYAQRLLSSPGKHDGLHWEAKAGESPMIGGFAVVAFPAQWGASGVMTFLVNHDGVVYQKTLGPKTADVARRMTSFNPDQTWTRVQP